MSITDPNAPDVGAQLQLVLDNMPSALVYTDAELRFVLAIRSERPA